MFFVLLICIFVYKLISRRDKRRISMLSRQVRQRVIYQPTYDDLLHTPEWESKRNTILNRDGHKCAYCSKTHNLQVHHKYYSKYPNGRKVEPWNYPDEALITLCDDCHKRVHSKKKIKVYYRRYSDNY